MTEFPKPQDGGSLHAALLELEILNSSEEPEFDQLTMLASMLCKTPMAMIGFYDMDRIWYKSRLGFAGSLENPVAAMNLNIRQTYVLEDAANDPRVKEHPMVQQLGIQSMMLVPLFNPEGLNVGHLAVADTQQRTFDDKQRHGLELLGAQVGKLLQLRLSSRETEPGKTAVSDALTQAITLFEYNVDAVLIADASSVIRGWNPRAADLFGISAAAVMGKMVHNAIIPERNYEAFMRLQEQHQKDGLPKQDFDVMVKRGDGSEFIATLGVSPTDIEGQIYFIVTIRELTDRRIVNRELEKQKSFYENILNKIPTDIAVFDLDHRYIFVNPGAIKDPQLRKKIIGMDDFEYARFRNRDESVARKRREQFLEAKNTGQVVRWEDSVKNPQGQTVTVLRRIFPVHDEAGQLSLFIGFGIDITERKLLEEKQSVMMKQLSAQNTQLLDFCNIVSHNLRGPLTNMAMLVEFINDSNDYEEIKLLTSKLTPVIDSLNTTFNELVESIQVRQDMEIASEQIVLQECLQRTLDGLKMEINKTEAQIIVNFDDAPVVHYPPKYLNSIFHNLVSNALKYRSPDRKPRIELSTRRNKDSILLMVRDNGLGIDLTKHIDSVFKIGKVFHKHPNAKGLGLYMTKTQIEAMNGKIWVESIPDEGAVFYVVFNNQH
ncbi:PAS domain S-box protein [Pedobacter sp. SAFR-022]|uniref:PAS domain S-box protein n=1 Tax=Pedobacter sp. SAFR-022 TaxID=3436861 RepID=UPI003F7E49F9